MQVYDTANRLAQEIRDSEEFKLYKKRKDEIHNDPEKKQKVEDFEKLRYEVQLMAYAGEAKDEEKNKKLEEMYMTLVENKDNPMSLAVKKDLIKIVLEDILKMPIKSFSVKKMKKAESLV